MAYKVYFDTVAIRIIGRALKNAELPYDIRDAIVVSPLSALEVMSHLTIANADEVLQEIHAMHSWLNPSGADILPWPEDVLATIGFGKAAEAVNMAETIGVALKNCLNATSSSQLKDEAGELKDFLDKAKLGNAQSFAQLLDSLRAQPPTDDAFSEALFHGIAARVTADQESRTVTEFTTIFSAYHEFERVKLEVALTSENYNPLTREHQNDLFDASQLIYLGIPELYFLTCDKGFNRVKRSAQASRIIVVSQEDLSDAEKVEALLRRIIGPAAATILPS